MNSDSHSHSHFQKQVGSQKQVDYVSTFNYVSGDINEVGISTIKQGGRLPGI